MKKILILVVAAASVATLGFASCGAPAGGEVSAQQAVIDNIMTRSSVRSYTSQEVEQEKIETMLRAAMAAPTGMNKQPWEFVVITDKEILEALPAVAPGMRMAAKAPLAIAVLGDTSAGVYWTQDGSAATENLLLAAHAMGLGAVWCGAYPDTEAGRVAKITELLKLPEGIMALCVIVIGYPDSEPTVKDKWKPEKIHYNTYSAK